MGGNYNVWEALQRQEQSKYTPVYMTNSEGGYIRDNRGNMIIDPTKTAATYGQAQQSAPPPQPPVSNDAKAASSAKREQFLKETKAILSNPDVSEADKVKARSMAAGAILNDLNTKISGFIDFGSHKMVEPPKFQTGLGGDANNKQLEAYARAATDLNPTLRGNGPFGMKNGDQLSADVDEIKKAYKEFSEIGLRVDDNKSNYQVNDEQKAMMGILFNNMSGMQQHYDEMSKGANKELFSNKDLSDYTKTFDDRDAISSAVNDSMSMAGAPKQSSWSKFQDTFTSGDFNRWAATAAVVLGAAAAAPYVASAMSTPAAAGAGAGASPLAVTGGGAPISGALATGGSAVGTTGGAGLGLSSGAGGALGGTAGGGAIAGGAGLAGGAALGAGGAAAQSIAAINTPLMPTSGAGAGLFSNPAVIGAGVGAAGSIAGGLIQNEALGDATAAANEQSQNAIAAAERANAQAQAIIEANRVRGVGAIEQYNQFARDTLSAGYSDISNLYRNAGNNSQGIINQGVGAARNDLTAGYGQAEGAVNSGINAARGDITAGSNAGIGTLRDAYGQSMANLEAGYNQASQDIQRGYATGDQRLVESASQQLQSYKDMYDQSIGRLDPYRQAGTTALSNIQNGVNLGDAAYQFRLKDQQNAINAQLAAQGLGGSGRATQIMGEQVARLTADEARRQFDNNMQLANLGYGATTQANQLSSAQGQNAAGVYDRTGQLRASNAVGQGMALGGLATDRTTQANNVGANYAGQISNLQAGTGQQLGGLEAQRGTQLADLYSRRGADLSTNSLYGTQQTLANQQLYNDKIAAAMSDVYGGTANLYSKTGSDIANVNMGAGTTGSQANLSMGANIAGSYNQLGQQLPQMYAAQGMNTANALGGVTNAYTGYQNRVDQQNMYQQNMDLQNKWLQAYQGKKA